MPFGLRPGLEPPPEPPQRIPIHPQAYNLNAGLQPPPPPPPKDHTLRNALLEALPTLGSGLLGIIGGPDSALGQFGAGGAGAASNILIQQNLDRQRREADAEANVIKNVHSTMEKVRRVQDPRYQAAVREYNQLMQDNKLTGKEAARIHQTIMGLGNIEDAVQRADDERELLANQKLAEMNAQVKADFDAKRRVHKVMINGQEVMLTPEQLTDYTIDEARISRQQAEDRARDNRFIAAQEGIKERHGLNLDKWFATSIKEFAGAEKAVNQLQASLDRFVKAPNGSAEQAKAAEELNSKVDGFTAMIGRSVGERGAFTDQDSLRYARIITPGLIISKLAPDVAQKRIDDIRDLVSSAKSQQVTFYGLMRPESPLLAHLRNQEQTRNVPGELAGQTSTIGEDSRYPGWIAKVEWGPQGYGKYWKRKEGNATPAAK